MNNRVTEGFTTNTNRNETYARVSQNDNDANQSLLTERANQEQPGFLTKWVINPIKYIGSFFCSRRNDTLSEDDNRVFSPLSKKVNNLISFNTQIKTRIGIMILYQRTDLDYFSNLVNSIQKEEYINEMLVNIYNIRL